MQNSHSIGEICPGQPCAFPQAFFVSCATSGWAVDEKQSWAIDEGRATSLWRRRGPPVTLFSTAVL
eukprot:2345494-Amphidinium_carterae.1